ncbi:MAG: hypothetical protein ABJH05_00135 [Fulvivirga sp.]
MIEYNKSLPLFSLHVYKCGGTSFNRLLKLWFHFGFFKHYYDNVNVKAPNRVSDWILNQKLLPICIHGHFNPLKNIGVHDFYPNAQQYITFLRNPLEAHISAYNYLRETSDKGTFYWEGQKRTFNMEIDEFIETKNLNYLIWLPFNFTELNFKEIIDSNFIHIGITEEYEKSVKIIAKKLNRPYIKFKRLNVSNKVNQKPSESSIRIFNEKYSLENKIFNYARLLNCN